MRQHTTVAAIAVLLLAATACGSGDDLPDSERSYLDAVYKAASEKGSGIKGYGDDKNLKLGRDVCDRLGDGHAPTDVVQNIKQNNDAAVSKVASEIVGNAQIHLCPPE